MDNKIQTNRSEKRGFERIDSIIKKKFSDKGPVYAKHEFQEYGIRLSEVLHDGKHKSFYIKLAKEKPRGLLEEAKNFAKDYNTNQLNRGKIFMWKLGQLEKENELLNKRKNQSKSS